MLTLQALYFRYLFGVSLEQADEASQMSVEGQSILLSIFCWLFASPNTGPLNNSVERHWTFVVSCHTVYVPNPLIQVVE
jgi:hypothetical protein